MVDPPMLVGDALGTKPVGCRVFFSLAIDEWGAKMAFLTKILETSDQENVLDSNFLLQTLEISMLEDLTKKNRDFDHFLVRYSKNRGIFCCISTFSAERRKSLYLGEYESASLQI